MSPRRTVPRPPVHESADDLRTAWAELQRVWPETIARAQALPADAVHERVRGEWSFVETLRHLLFVADAWGRRALLGELSPYDPLDLPPTGMRNPAIPHDVDARPSLDEVLALRNERIAVVHGILERLTDDELADGTVRVRGAGYPRAGTFEVRRCANALVDEEWQHRLYAERDLAILAER